MLWVKGLNKFFKIKKFKLFNSKIRLSINTLREMKIQKEIMANLKLKKMCFWIIIYNKIKIHITFHKAWNNLIKTFINS